jgi:hypothetical protein
MCWSSLIAKTCGERGKLHHDYRRLNFGPRSVAEHQGCVKYNILIANTKAKDSVFRYKHGSQESGENFFVMGNICIMKEE